MKQFFSLVFLASITLNAADPQNNKDDQQDIRSLSADFRSITLTNESDHTKTTYPIANRDYLYTLCIPTSLRITKLVLDNDKLGCSHFYQQDRYLPEIECWYSPYDCGIDATVTIINGQKEKPYQQANAIGSASGTTYFDGINKQNCAVFIQNKLFCSFSHKPQGYLIYTFDLSQKQDQESIRRAPEKNPIIKTDTGEAYTLLLHPDHNTFLLSKNMRLGECLHVYTASLYTFNTSENKAENINNFVVRSKIVKMCCLGDTHYLGIYDNGNVVFFGHEQNEEYIYNQEYPYPFKDVITNFTSKDIYPHIALMTKEGTIFSGTVKRTQKELELSMITKINNHNDAQLYYNVNTLGILTNQAKSYKSEADIPEKFEALPPIDTSIIVILPIDENDN